MNILDSIKQKRKERKEALKLKQELSSAIEYFTPGCDGFLKGAFNGFLEEKAIQIVLKDHHIIVVEYNCI